jgi:dipeptidyl-peptidase 4
MGFHEQSEAAYTRPAQIPRERYVRAESFLKPNAEGLIRNLRVEPHWFPDGASFWFVYESGAGDECRIFDLELGTNEPVFDHAMLAASISELTGTHLDPARLPLQTLSFPNGPSHLSMTIDDQTAVSCDLNSNTCTVMPASTGEAASENADTNEAGKTIRSIDHNLWLSDSVSESPHQLTHDGTPANAYGEPLPSPLPDAGIDPVLKSNDGSSIGMWSPDSQKFLTFRLNTADTGEFGLVQSHPLDGSVRPRTFTYSYPLPGDETVPQASLVLVDAGTSSVLDVDTRPLDQLYYGHPVRKGWVWWSADSTTVYLIRRERGFKAYSLEAIDVTSGASRTVVAEEAATAIDPFTFDSRIPLIRVIEKHSEVLWFSQRSGWAHFYLYDLASGELARQLTHGAWNVSAICHIDEDARMLYFTGVGREPDVDPYYDLLYRVSLDGGEPELLTPENATHLTQFAPRGSHFIDTFSTVDTPPVTVARKADGTLVDEVCKADISTLLQTGWKPPTRFCARNRDGKETVYGVLLLPSDHDHLAPLPVLDDIYAGPHVNRVPTAFTDSIRGRDAGFFRNESYWQATAFAELGFAVVMIDGAGRPGRSKAEHDRSYMNVREGGLPDHLSAIRHLSETYPFLDLDRVGIYGNSAGGFPSVSALLDYPDFYRVGVASGGNHDHRLDKANWIERYMGFPPGEHYVEQANTQGVARLKGKLLLIHSEMDENVHIASTLVVINALIKANKDFDFLVMPNRPHFSTEDPYFIRRRWDYFVRHLLDSEPPANYQIGELVS